MKPPHKRLLAVLGVATVALILTIRACSNSTASDNAERVAASPPRPVLSVTVAQPHPEHFPDTLDASGNIAAWQEAIIGAEPNGFRVTEVRADVGDVVRRGQRLAVFSPVTVDADLAQSRAAVAEAKANYLEAEVNAQRARRLQSTSALSVQQIDQYLAAERAAAARLEAAQAVERGQRIRLAQTAVLAPDDGVISSRTATVGAVVPAGQELFRLIRGGRLEWQADVPSAELARLTAGWSVRVALPDGTVVFGTVRVAAPSVDVANRQGRVYVDLPPTSTARAGMFAQGQFELGQSMVMALPQSAIEIRDGKSYVMRILPDARVAQTPVTLGRRLGDRVELVDGLHVGERVVASGAAFLADGDLVRVVGTTMTVPGPIHPAGSH